MSKKSKKPTKTELRYQELFEESMRMGLQSSTVLLALHNLTEHLEKKHKKKVFKMDIEPWLSVMEENSKCLRANAEIMIKNLEFLKKVLSKYE